MQKSRQQDSLSLTLSHLRVKPDSRDSYAAPVGPRGSVQGLLLWNDGQRAAVLADR